VFSCYLTFSLFFRTMGFETAIKPVVVVNAANVGHTFADSVLKMPGEFCWRGVFLAAAYFKQEWNLKVVIVVTQTLWQ
jgi:hypothetical protein